MSMALLPKLESTDTSTEEKLQILSKGRDDIPLRLGTLYALT